MQVKEIPGLRVKIYVNNSYQCVIIDQIRAVDKKRLIRLEGVVSQSEMDLIDNGLRQVLCL